MAKLKTANYLNIGCGTNYHPDWINIDLESTSSDVIAHDVRMGLPFDNATIDYIYCSHLLEHLTKHEGQKFLENVVRVLNPQGVVRLVVPDLETIAKIYLEKLKAVEEGIISEESNYDWMLLELYDQTVRNVRGGKMAKYLSKNDIKNKGFIISRIGREAEKIWEEQKNPNITKLLSKIRSKSFSFLFQKTRSEAARVVVRILAGKEMQTVFDEGIFRKSGEIHLQMYDRFSLHRLMKTVGLQDIHKCRAEESHIPNFNSFGLDVIDGKIRKPDSLFMEGIKL